MSVNEKILIACFLGQILWTMIVMGAAGRVRTRAAMAGRVGREAALGKGGWPDDVLKFGNNMNNQFETPTLFYGLVLLTLQLKLAGPIMAAMAVVYLASRLAHTAVHITTNHVPHRFGIFLIGLVALSTMAILLILDLTMGTIL